MKRIIFVCLLAFAFVLTVHSQAGKIREITGEVQLKPAGSSVFIPAAPGAAVAQDTIVSTGIRSTAIIDVGSSSVVVRPLTRLSLSEISGSSGNENLNISLQSGRIRVDVKPPSGTKANATVTSPTATASVRGTSFDMDYRNLDVFDGKVFWVGQNKLGVTVRSGNRNKIKIDGYPQYPVELVEAGLAPHRPRGAGESMETVSSSGSEIINSYVYGVIVVDVTTGLP